jgi:CoA:oxalate CoA-transferase
MSTPPLSGLTVLDFSQLLAGPVAALRLADLGATVIKIERPGIGDLSRALYIPGMDNEGVSPLFHTINRNKYSFAADLKNTDDLAKVRRLISKADVMIENFRPGVMQRVGLDYQAVNSINPHIIYGSVTGYGAEGPWAGLPGQDLLAQSVSGLLWLSGDAGQGPVPMGVAIADILTGAHLVQGLLAALVRRGMTGAGAHVEVSLLESLVDLQFEELTAWLNDGQREPKRSAVNNAHAYPGAPYGVYQTADGYLAIAMGSLAQLGRAIACPELAQFDSRHDTFASRDQIKALLAAHLRSHTNAHWLERLRSVDYWCAPVMRWGDLLAHEAFKCLDMLQEIPNSNGLALRTTRCPVRIDGERPRTRLGAPGIGEHNDWVKDRYL